MFCPQCGTENHDNSVFCINCGTDFIESIEKNREDDTIKSPKKKLKFGEMISIGLVVLTIIGAAALIILKPSSLFDRTGSYPERLEVGDEVAYCSDAEEEHIRKDENSIWKYIDNELIVFLANEATETEAKELANVYGAELTGFISIANVCQWRLNACMSLQELERLADELSFDSSISKASINIIDELAISSMPTSESSYWEKDEYNWGYRDIHGESGWNNRELMIDSVSIGVLDLDIEENPDLDYTILREGFYEDEIRDGHGTHVTGIATANSNNDEGIAGVYPNYNGRGNLLAFDQIDSNGNGISYMRKMNDLALMLMHDVRVINLSLGLRSELIYSIQKQMQENRKDADEIKGMQTLADYWDEYLCRLINGGFQFLIVNSAGNESNRNNGTDSYSYVKNPQISKEEPFEYICLDSDEKRNKYLVEGTTEEFAIVDSKYNHYFSFIENSKVKERVISVGAYNKNRKITDFSNMGERVDIMAPGVDIWSLWIRNSEGKYELMKMSGTSMAAPYVTGAIACIWALDKDLTASEVRSLLLQNVNGEKAQDWIYDSYTDCTKPMLNLERSLELAKDYIKNNLKNREESVEKTIVNVAVLEKETEEKIDHALVTITDKDGNKLYDRAGVRPEGEEDRELGEEEWSGFALPEGTYHVTVEAKGYKTITSERNTDEFLTESAINVFEEAMELFESILNTPAWVFELEKDENAIRVYDVSAELQKYLSTKLVPKYGVMDTTLVEQMGESPPWSDRDINGLLSSTIMDFDKDGWEEMLVVEYESVSLTENGDSRVETKLHFQMYEYVYEKQKVALQTEEVITLYGDFVNGEMKNGCFVYEYDGATYLVMDHFIDSFSSDVGGTTTVNFWQYDGKQFNYILGLGFQETNDKVKVRRADDKPFNSDISCCADFIVKLTSSWESINTSSSEDARLSYEIYNNEMKEMGLSAHDGRLAVIFDWDLEIEHHTYTPFLDACNGMVVSQIYSSDEGEITFILSLSSRATLGHPGIAELERIDFQGSLDAYRNSENNT